MGQGTSSDVLTILYIVAGACLLLIAAGFALHRAGRLRGRRAGMAFALLSVLPIVAGIIIYAYGYLR